MSTHTYPNKSKTEEKEKHNDNSPRFVIKKDGDYLVACCIDGNSYDWLDKLNCRSISHRYDLIKMTKALKIAESKNIGRTQDPELLPDNPLINVVHTKKHGSDREQDRFEKNVECVKEMNRVRGYIANSIQVTPLDASPYGTYELASAGPYLISDPSVTQLFDRKQCAEIILTDYMKIYKELVLESTNFSKIPGCTIDLIDNKIYNWRIIIDCARMNLGDESMTLPASWGHVILELKLHPDLHPSYPPSMTVIAPTFKQDLSSRISRSKFTKIEYWCCDRTPYDIVVRTIRILKQHGEIAGIKQTDTLKVKEQTRKLLESLESTLFNVASMMGNGADEEDEIDKDHKFIAVKPDAAVIVRRKSKREETGTGYGHNGASVWDPNEYDRVLKERTHRFTLNVNSMIVTLNKIMDLEKGDISFTVDMFKNSAMFKYFVNLFKNVSILEITNNSRYYRAVFDMLQLYCLDGTIRLFYDPDESRSMYRCIVDLDAKARSCLEIDDSNENANIIFNIHSMIEEPYKLYVASLSKMLPQSHDVSPITTSIRHPMNKISHPKSGSKRVKDVDVDQDVESDNWTKQTDKTIGTQDTKASGVTQDTQITKTSSAIGTSLVAKSSTDIADAMNLYKHMMSKYKYKIGMKLHDDPSYYYKDFAVEDGSKNMKSCYKRMSSEIPALIESLTVDENALVLLYVDRAKPNCIRYLLNGPPGTPYSRGLYIFDSYCGAQYPTTAPEFHFVNTGGFRFNPNLYSEGKVCLSLLGTYSGPEPHESEKWNPKLSTLSQVIISIQSLIFTDQPYFNEPGYERDRKTASGMEASRAYNEGVRVSTMKAAIIDTITHASSYPQFTNAILTHFYLQKEKIIEQCVKWVDECSDVDDNKNKMTRYFEEIKTIFSQLKIPQND